jgi:hypothetical protein
MGENYIMHESTSAHITRTRRAARCLSVGLTVVAAMSLSCIQGLLPIVPGMTAPGTTTTVIMVRHAERDPGLDPPLNAEGTLRALALRAALRENGVTAIFCTDLIRNRDSVQPLADALGLELNLVSPVLYADTVSAANIVANDIFARFSGGTVLFCGNIGSAGANVNGINEDLFTRLGGTGTPPERYQDLYVMVIRDDAPVNVIKTEYGGPSSLDP